MLLAPLVAGIGIQWALLTECRTMYSILWQKRMVIQWRRLSLRVLKLMLTFSPVPFCTLKLLWIMELATKFMSENSMDISFSLLWSPHGSSDLCYYLREKRKESGVISLNDAKREEMRMFFHHLIRVGLHLALFTTSHYKGFLIFTLSHLFLPL